MTVFTKLKNSYEDHLKNKTNLSILILKFLQHLLENKPNLLDK